MASRGTAGEEAGARCDPLLREGTLALAERTCGALPWNHNLIAHHKHSVLDQFKDEFKSNHQ